MTQDGLDRAYVDWQCNTFKMDNTLVYHILSMIFIDTDVYVCLKQRKRSKDGRSVFINIQKWFFDPDHVIRQATEAERKL